MSATVCRESGKPAYPWAGTCMEHGGDACLIVLPDYVNDMEQLRNEMHHALVLADGSLTWCEHRHHHYTEPDDALSDAIAAVHAFTRPRGAR